MDNSLIEAYKCGLITREVFVQNVSNKRNCCKNYIELLSDIVVMYLEK